jgi:hypothetical protein
MSRRRPESLPAKPPARPFKSPGRPSPTPCSRRVPVADELPPTVTVVFSTHSAQSPAEIAIQSSKPFSDVPPKDIRPIFLSKCKECAKLCDWSLSAKDVKAKAVKTALLKQIIAGFGVQLVSRSLTADLFAAFFEMLSANLFRPFPEIQVGLFGDIRDSLMDAAWPHVSLVYESLLASLNCAGLAELPTSFVTRLVGNLLSPDDREREAAKHALTAIYTKFTNQNAHVRHRVWAIFAKQHCTAELLEFSIAVVSSLNRPLRSDVIDGFTRLILPLHCLSHYPQFSRQLTQVIYRYIAKADALLAITIAYLHRHWPVVNRTKQLLFLKEYEELLVTFEQQASPEMFTSFFKKTAEFVNDDSSTIAEAALGIVRRSGLYAALKASSASVFYPLTLDIHCAAKEHWDSDIREDATSALEVMRSIDAAGFAKATESLRRAKARHASAFGVAKTGWAKAVALARSKDPAVVQVGDIESLR